MNSQNETLSAAREDFGVRPEAPPRDSCAGVSGPWTNGGDYCGVPQPPGRSMPFVTLTVPPRGS